MAIGLLIAFGLPSHIVLQNAPFSIWQIVVPMVVGAIVSLCGRLLQPRKTLPRSQ